MATSDDHVTIEERQARTQSEGALLAARNLARLSDLLRECPFCGNAAEMTTGRSADISSRVFFNPACPTCNYAFEDGFFNGDDAVKAWNTRAGQQEVIKVLEGLSLLRTDGSRCFCEDGLYNKQHQDNCLRARALWAKLQIKSDSGEV